jgi:hypothetical protein
MRLASFVLEQFHIAIIPDPLRKVLICDGPLKPVIDKPSEFDRAHTLSQMISDHFMALGELLERVPSPFLWSRDEFGDAD